MLIAEPTLRDKYQCEQMLQLPFTSPGNQSVHHSPVQLSLGSYGLHCTALQSVDVSTTVCTTACSALQIIQMMGMRASSSIMQYNTKSCTRCNQSCRYSVHDTSYLVCIKCAHLFDILGDLPSFCLPKNIKTFSVIYFHIHYSLEVLGNI